MQILKGTANNLREKKIDQKIVHGSECSTKPGPGEGEKKCDDWKTSQKRMLFVAESVQPAQLLKRWEISKWEDK